MAWNRGRKEKEDAGMFRFFFLLFFFLLCILIFIYICTSVLFPKADFSLIIMELSAMCVKCMLEINSLFFILYNIATGPVLGSAEERTNVLFELNSVSAVWCFSPVSKKVITRTSARFQLNHIRLEERTKEPRDARVSSWTGCAWASKATNVPKAPEAPKAHVQQFHSTTFNVTHFLKSLKKGASMKDTVSLMIICNLASCCQK